MTNKDQCREAFEEHVLAPNGFYENGAGWVARNADGTYRHENIQARWTAWQAARSTPAAPVTYMPWDNFPSYLIDHCEGDTITEEGLQRALAAMLLNPQYSSADPAAPVELPEPDAYLYVNGDHRGVGLAWRGDMDLAEGTERHNLFTEQQVRELLSEAGTVLPETPESPPKSTETRMDASSDRGGGVLPEPEVDLPRAGQKALDEYLKWCKEHSIVPDVGGAFAHAIRAGAEIAAAPKLPQGDGWIPVGEQLPESGKPVLLDIGKKYPIRAMWAARFTLEADDEDPDWGEWNEDGDMYYCPEGWYEWNEHEETHWRVSVEPLRWMPLPQPPKEQSTKGER